MAVAIVNENVLMKTNLRLFLIKVTFQVTMSLIVINKIPTLMNFLIMDKAIKVGLSPIIKCIQHK